MAAEATPTSATHETSAATIATRPRRRFRGCVDTSFLTADYLPTHGWPPSSGRWRGNQSAGGTLSPDPVRVLLLTRIYGVASPVPDTCGTPVPDTTGVTGFHPGGSAYVYSRRGRRPGDRAGQALRHDDGGRRGRPRHREWRGPGAPRPERRRQDHAPPDAVRLDPARRRVCRAPRPQARSSRRRRARRG